MGAVTRYRKSTHNSVGVHVTRVVLDRIHECTAGAVTVLTSFCFVFIVFACLFALRAFLCAAFCGFFGGHNYWP